MVPKTMPPVPVFHRSLVNKARTTFAFRPIVLLLILIILLNVLPHNYHEIGIKYAKDIAGCDVDAPLNTMPVAEWSEITAIMNKEYSYFPKDQTSGVIYSLYLGNHTALLNSTGARNKRYAKRHGYAFLAIHDDLALMNALFEDLGSLDMRQLRKLQKYLIALALVSRYEWTLFIDADAGIYDCARTVESYFKWPAKLYISSYEKYPLFLNNGAIIFKRDAFTTSFLNKLLQRPKQPALYPMARHSKVISNLSEWDGYGTGTIADQKWTIDTISMMPFHIVSANIAFVDDLQCFPKYSPKNCSTTEHPPPFIVHAIGIKTDPSTREYTRANYLYENYFKDAQC